jgi:hypothetical protein
MAHNQEMLVKKKDEWANKVRIIGISIDQDREKLLSHVQTNKWEDVEHYHRANSTCSQTYGVRGVPHVMLIDKQGTIVFKGHPASRPNLEDDLTKLGKGEVLTGAEIVTLKSEDKEEDAEKIKPEDDFTEKGENIDPAVVEEITKFKTACQDLTSNAEITETAKGMQRSFAVIVHQASYIPSEKKFYAKYENYRVLVGPQEKITKLQGELE